MWVTVYLLIQGIIFIWLISYAKDRAGILYWLSFLIPLNSISFEWLSLWSWAKLVFVVGFIGWLIRDRTQHRKNWRVIENSYTNMGPFILFFVYSIAITLFWMVYDYTIGYRFGIAESLGLGIAQSTLRYPVQLFSYITQWGLVFVGVWFTCNIEDTRNAIKGYIHGNVLNAIAGFYQIVALQFSLPWFKGFWILRDERFNPDVLRSGMAHLGSISIPRLYGLGGEPKHTGANLVIALFFLLLLYTFSNENAENEINTKGIIITVLLVALLFTFSVGAWVAFTFCIGFILLLGIWSRSIGPIVWFGVVITIIGTLISTTNSEILGIVTNKYVGVKLSEDSVTKYVDFAILTLLADHPLQLLIGRGAGGSDMWLPHILLETGKPVSPAYTFTRFILEQGIFGCFLFAFCIATWSRTLSNSGNHIFNYFVVGGACLIMVSHTTAIYGFLLLCGSMVASVDGQRWRLLRRKRAISGQRLANPPIWRRLRRSNQQSSVNQKMAVQQD